MQPGPHPDAIDTRLVLRIYAWTVTTVGTVAALFIDVLPFFRFEDATDYDLPGVAFGRAALMRLTAAGVTAFGVTAIGMSRIESPISRQRALFWFAIAHLVPGLFFFAISSAVFYAVVPSPLQWIPVAMGTVLMYVALTSAHAPRLARPFREPFRRGEIDGPVLVTRNRQDVTIGALQSQYEQHIREAAQVEERARLARDLHDAVKQQLFAIQTAAATVQERLATDEPGARSALDQVRSAARDAMTEMQALIDQLQAVPIENTGLVAALQRQCEALELRTGVKVALDAATLPASDRLPPGAVLALFRAVQEALANIARHARAQQVAVRLATSPDSVELWIRDDGVGFDPAAATSGMGMNNMRTRIAEVGGSVLMQSAPGRGTLVAFSIPCDTRSSGDYAKKAVAWLGASIALGVLLTTFGTWEHPWYVIAVAVTAITAARFAAAWYRVRRSPLTSVGANMAMMIGAAHWYSLDFNVTEGARHLAHVDVSAWLEKGILTIDGVAHRVYREGMMHGDFLLEREGVVLARATKPSAFRSRLVIRHDGRTYELARQSLWRRTFVVRSGDTEIGTLTPNSAWRRDAAVKLPEQWPLPLKVFVIWLVIILWNRDYNAAAGAVGPG